MNLHAFLNELSETPVADSLHAARERMSRFAGLLAQLRRTAGLRIPLRTHSDLTQLLLASEYPLARWLNDQAVSREARNLVLSHVAHSPFLGRDDPEEVIDEVGITECRHNGLPGEGLLVAMVSDGLPISLNSAEEWDNDWLEVAALHLNEDADLEETIVQLRHASSSAHVVTHEEWLLEPRWSVRDGRHLWDMREQWYPSLQFCREVKGQLGQLQAGSRALTQIAKRLSELEGYAHHWEEGGFDADALPSKCTPDSQATQQQYSADRTFTTDSGEIVVFSWHVRYTPGAGRIYFHPITQLRTLLVGYIGPKPPSVNHP